MMELVVNSDDLVVLSVEAVEHHGLLVNSCGDELVVQWRAVNGVVMVLCKPGVVLHNISKAVRGNRSWTVTTSSGSHTVLH